MVLSYKTQKILNNYSSSYTLEMKIKSPRNDFGLGVSCLDTGSGEKPSKPFGSPMNIQEFTCIHVKDNKLGIRIGTTSQRKNDTKFWARILFRGGF